MDCSKEVAAEVQETIHHEYGIHRKLITTHNPQANSRVEQVHQTVQNMVRSFKLSGKQDLDDTSGWLGILRAVQQAVIGTVHTTNKAIPSQLVFWQDAILNIQFQAALQYLRQQKLKSIKHNDRKENLTWLHYQYAAGDHVIIWLASQRNMA